MPSVSVVVPLPTARQSPWVSASGVSPTGHTTSVLLAPHSKKSLSAGGAQETSRKAAMTISIIFIADSPGLAPDQDQELVPVRVADQARAQELVQAQVLAQAPVDLQLLPPLLRDVLLE